MRLASPRCDLLHLDATCFTSMRLAATYATDAPGATWSQRSASSTTRPKTTSQRAATASAPSSNHRCDLSQLVAARRSKLTHTDRAPTPASPATTRRTSPPTTRRQPPPDRRSRPSARHTAKRLHRTSTSLLNVLLCLSLNKSRQIAKLLDRTSISYASRTDRG